MDGHGRREEKRGRDDVNSHALCRFTCGVVYSRRIGREYFRERSGLYTRARRTSTRWRVRRGMLPIGKPHPLLVHFPIALVLAAAGAEIVATRTRRASWRAISPQPSCRGGDGRRDVNTRAGAVTTPSK